jgi:hypothetical protein
LANRSVALSRASVTLDPGQQQHPALAASASVLNDPLREPHSHWHEHAPIVHAHRHGSDVHHRHSH